MTPHWIFQLGEKACTWGNAAVARVWRQTPCNAAETWNMGYVIVGVVLVLGVFAIYRRIYAWHTYYSG